MPMQALNRTIATLAALCIIVTACSSDESGTNTRAGAVETTSTATSVLPTSTSAAPTTSVAVASTSTIEEPPLPCEIESPSSEFDTTFYAKQCTVLGVAV